jgi:hypothetical protein
MFSNRRAKAFSFSAGAWHYSPGLVLLFICGLRMRRKVPTLGTGLLSATCWRIRVVAATTASAPHTLHARIQSTQGWCSLVHPSTGPNEESELIAFWLALFGKKRPSSGLLPLLRTDGVRPIKDALQTVSLWLY